MFLPSRPSAAPVMALVLAVSVAVSAFADAPPPRYLVRIVESFDGDNTRAHDINDFGVITGESGYHAFVGWPDGTIESIETLPCDISKGLRINNAGQVAGTTTVFPEGGGAGTSSAFRYTPGIGMEELEVPEGSHTRVVDMNEAGDVVGEYRVGTAYHGYIYTDEGGVEDLGGLAEYSTDVLDINDAGQVVGSSWTEDWDIHAVLWEDGTLHDLGTLGGDSSKAYYVNTAGVVVGDSRTADGMLHAFRYSAERGLEGLPAMEGMVACTASWITDSGVITGWWEDEDFRRRAFYYTDDDGMVDIGVDIGSTAWTGPVAANDAGQILLWAMEEEFYEVFAMLYSPGAGVHDLNDLLTIDLGWKLDTPVDINTAGQIVAYGYAPTPEGPWRYTSVLLTPVGRGDMNCDGAVDFDDIDAFVMALSDPDGYTADLPRCERMLADTNCDGSVDFGDIDAFVACLSGDCGCN